MASLFTRDGQYYVQFYDPDRQPPQKQYSLRTRSKREAERLKIELEDEQDAGRYDPWCHDPTTYLARGTDELTAEEALARFLEAKKREGCTPNTVHAYDDIISRFLRGAGLHRAVSTISRADINGYVRQDRLAAATRRKRYRHLKAWLRWLVHEDYLDDHPIRKMKPPKAGAKIPKAVTYADLKRICAEASPWFARLCRFAYYTGLRSGELGRLQWDHINRSKRLLYIYKQKSRKEGVVPLSTKALAILDEVEGARSGPVFNTEGRDNKRWVQYVSHRFRTLRRRAGLREGLSFHGLRHGFCTALAEAGKSAVVIKEAARHADISTSMRYVHLANDQLRDALDDVF